MEAYSTPTNKQRMETVRRQITQVIIDNKSSLKDLLSVYVYGSCLRNDYTDKSDIDILLIFKDIARTSNFVPRIRELFSRTVEHSDINLVYESEYLLRIHPGWSRHYYYDVKKSGQLVYGTDLLSNFKDGEINFEEAYRRLVELTQRLRFVMLNDQKNNEKEFWLKKYNKWVLISIMEFSALEQRSEFEPLRAFEEFVRIHQVEYEEFSTTYPFEKAEELLHFLEKTRTWILRSKNDFIGKTYTHVFYDLGQTIVDTDPVLANIDVEFNLPLWRKRGFKGTPEEFRKAKKLADYESESIKKQAGTDPSTWSRALAKVLKLSVKEEDFAKEIEDSFTYFVDNAVLCPGIKESITYLKNNGIKIYLISNGWNALIQRFLEKFDLTSAFDQVYISESEGLKKSEVSLFSRILSQNNIEASHCLMVGDRPDEDGYARKAGIDFAWYCQSPHFIPVREMEKYDYILVNHADIMRIVK